MTAPDALPGHDELLAHADFVRRIAHSLVRDEHAAEDVAQDALLAGLDPQRDRPRNLHAWLRGVTRNLARMRLRTDSNRALREAAAASPTDYPSPDAIVERLEINRRVVDAVTALEEPYRSTVVLRFFDDLPTGEIARRCGVPVETVRTRLKRALAMLRHRLDEDFGNRSSWVALLLLGWDRPGRTGRARVGSMAAVTGGALMGVKLVAAGVVAVLVGGIAWWMSQGAEVTNASSANDPHTLDAVQTPPPAPERQDARGVAAPAVPVPATPEPGGATFGGTVLTVDGRPVAGASVTATAVRPGDEIFVSSARPCTATTRVDGTFSVRLPKGTAMADVVAAAPGFAVTCLQRVPPGTTNEIRLAPEGVLTGRLLDPAGRPIQGAIVRAFRVLGREYIDSVVSKTAGDGKYRLGGFAACATQMQDGPMKTPFVDVRASGYGAAQITAVTLFPRLGETSERDIVLYPTRPLRVRVIDTESKVPVPGARVAIGLTTSGLQVQPSTDEQYHTLPHPAPFFEEGTTDDAGECTLAQTPSRGSSLLSIRAWKAGFTTEAEIVRGRPPLDDECVVVRLWPSCTLTGRVVDEDGAPVPGALVREAEDSPAQWLAPFGERWLPFVRTDAQGGYSLPGTRATAAGTAKWVLRAQSPEGPLPDGRVFSMFVGGSRSAEAEVRPRAGEVTRVPDFVLLRAKPSLFATFVVTDAAGRPVVDAMLMSGARDRPARTDGAGRATLHWDADAKPRIPRAPEPNGKPVTVIAPGLARVTVRCQPQELNPPEVRVVLTAGLRLTGRVHDRDGSPVADVSVSARESGNSDGRNVNTLTARDGTFVLEDFGASPLTVFVSDRPLNRRSTTLQDVRAGEAELEIELPTDETKRGDLVTTLVADEDDTPFVEASVRVDCRSPTYDPSSNAPGVVTVRGVPVGTWPVEASAPGRLTATTTATIVEGETTRVRLRLARGTAVAVRLVTDEQAGRFTIVATRVDLPPGTPGAGEDARVERVDADGIVRFDALRAGKYRLRHEIGFLMPGRVSACRVAAAPLAVGPGSSIWAQTALDFVPCGVLTPKIEDPAVPEPRDAGTVRTPCALEVLAADGERHRVLPSVIRGSTVPIPLVPGTYTVRLHLSSGRVRETEATIRVGEVTAVVFGP